MWAAPRGAWVGSWAGHGPWELARAVKRASLLPAPPSVGLLMVGAGRGRQAERARSRVLAAPAGTVPRRHAVPDGREGTRGHALADHPARQC